MRSVETHNQKTLPYEERLARDPRWALNEGGSHFESRSAVFASLTKITQRLDALGIPYAVVGGMALFAHGYRRFTDDVDLLVTREGLAKIHAALDGLGWLPPFAGSRHLRDTEFGVRIEFLVAGDFPGDGKPKTVAFPDPANVRVERDGIYFLSLPKLVDLKLASGMSNAGRLRDLADVIELVRLLTLPAAFAEQLDPSVRGKFGELWQAAQEAQ